MGKQKINANYDQEAAALANGLSPVCGIDEAGRGPLAGPVFAAAVILQQGNIPDGLADSKTLSKVQREKLYEQLGNVAEIGLGRATVEEIDCMNILSATMLAMTRAVNNLAMVPGYALVDGNSAPDVICKVRCVVKGDVKCLSIAAASIIAKVERDREMAILSDCFPGYGWDRNAGYGTPEHNLALKRLGPNVMHRKSFAPIRKMLELPLIS